MVFKVCPGCMARCWILKNEVSLHMLPPAGVLALSRRVGSAYFSYTVLSFLTPHRANNFEFTTSREYLRMSLSVLRRAQRDEQSIRNCAIVTETQNRYVSYWTSLHADFGPPHFMFFYREEF
jgi:hypothetical protein